MSKTKAIFVKLKATKFCILNGYLYWKDLGGILLNYLLGVQTKKPLRSFIREIVEDITIGKKP